MTPRILRILILACLSLGLRSFFIEFTESNARGPCLAVPFTKGPSAQTRAVEGPKNIQNVKVSFLPSGPD